MVNACSELSADEVKVSEGDHYLAVKTVFFQLLSQLVQERKLENNERCIWILLIS